MPQMQMMPESMQPGLLRLYLSSPTEKIFDVALDSVSRYRVYSVHNEQRRKEGAMDGLTIGDIAKQANVHIETLRYYERRGLVPRPRRSISNYRLYPEDTVRRVRFIKSAQELGFSLKGIVELLSLRAAPKTRCVEIRERAEAKITDIEAKIASLGAMKHALSKLVIECSGDGPITDCPILESFDSGKGV